MRSWSRDTLAMPITTGQSEDGSRRPLVLELNHRPFISSQCLLLAQSGHAKRHEECPLLG
jgi:hypothetical protein